MSADPQVQTWLKLMGDLAGKSADRGGTNVVYSTSWHTDPDEAYLIRADRLARAYQASHGLTPILADVLARAIDIPGQTAGQLANRDHVSSAKSYMATAPARLAKLGYLRFDQQGRNRFYYPTRAGYNAVRGWELVQNRTPIGDVPGSAASWLADKAKTLWAFRKVTAAQLMTPWDDLINLSADRIPAAWEVCPWVVRKWLCRADLSSVLMINYMIFYPDWSYLSATAMLADLVNFTQAPRGEQLSVAVNRRMNRMERAGLVQRLPTPRDLRQERGYWMLRLNPMFPAAPGH